MAGSMVLAIGSSFNAHASTTPATGDPAWRQCKAASKALEKEQRALKDTASHVGRATALLQTCGSPPMCDGYRRELHIVEAREPKLHAAIDQRESKVGQSCGS